MFGRVRDFEVDCDNLPDLNNWLLVVDQLVREDMPAKVGIARVDVQFDVRL